MERAFLSNFSLSRMVEDGGTSRAEDSEDVS